MMTDTERAEMTVRLAKITPGECKTSVLKPLIMVGAIKYWNFIAHAPEDMRKLLVENAELMDTIEAVAIQGLGLPEPNPDNDEIPTEWNGLLSEKVRKLRVENVELVRQISRLKGRK